MPVIETRELTKLYPSGAGIRDIHLKVEAGEIFGFLGANGAGKTTTIRLLLGLLRPDQGEIFVLGTNPLQGEGIPCRRRLGYLPGELALYSHLTGGALLSFFSQAMGGQGKEARDLAERLSFSREDFKGKISTYSRGMKQKLGLMIALQHRPELLIMDEPTTGLDPLMQLRVYELLDEYVQSGGTVFMSSHNLTEVERVCHRVAIIRDGRLLSIEDVEQLQRHSLYSLELLLDPLLSPTDLRELGLQDIHVIDDWVQGKFAGDLDTFLRAIMARSTIKDCSCVGGKLEDLFLTYYGQREGQG